MDLDGRMNEDLRDMLVELVAAAESLKAHPEMRGPSDRMEYAIDALDVYLGSSPSYVPEMVLNRSGVSLRDYWEKGKSGC